MTRDERQALCIKRWIDSKGCGSAVCATGFGKTRIATKIAQLLVYKYPTLKILVVVPTITLKEQWSAILDKLGLGLNCTVEVINTVIKHEWKCNLLVIDELHVMAATTFSQVFTKVHYKWILGLTATLERTDDKHKICEKYCPVCDTVPVIECLANGWVSPFKEYQVLVDVDDINVYQSWNKEFIEHFEFFDYSWDIVNKCLGKDGYKYRLQMAKERCKSNKDDEIKMFKLITFHATAFMRIMQKRKAFVNNHPKKLELCRKIIEARPNSKIITFSNSIKMAEQIGIGDVYSGKTSKKKGRITLEEFNEKPFGVLNSIKRLDAGLDVPGISVAIIIGTDSSKIRAIQRLGRSIRAEKGKQAEIFNIIINNTSETKWFSNAHSNGNYITIDEEGLSDVLQGKQPKPYLKKVRNFQFKY